MTKKGAKYQVFNKHFFIDLSSYKLRYEVTVDGLAKASGSIKLPAIKPRKAGLISVPATALKVEGAGERFLTFSLIDKSGHEVAWEQFALKSLAAKKPAKIAKVVADGLIGFDLAKIVDKQGNLTFPEQVVAPQLTLWRAPTDNDAIGKSAHYWNLWGLRDLKLANSKVTTKGKSALVTKTWKTGKGIAVKHLQKIEVVAGQIKITETVTLPKLLNDVARVGINFELNGALENYEYFGVGPHESVPDRALGKVGRYFGKVEAQLTDYIKPQECGGRVGIRWFELRNKQNRGLRIELDKPRMVTVLPVTSVALADATHNVYVKRSGTTAVTIDAAHRGVGTASCGPDTLDSYKIRPGIHKFTWIMSSV